MRRILQCLAFYWLTMMAPNVLAECTANNRDISLEQIQGIFNKITNDAKWDIGAELRWGYFFIDDERKHLQDLSEALNKESYQELDLSFNGKSYTLHVEKPEVLTPETMYARGHYLAEIAHQHCVKRYDGFDVGK